MIYQLYYDEVTQAGATFYKENPAIYSKLDLRVCEEAVTRGLLDADINFPNRPCLCEWAAPIALYLDRNRNKNRIDAFIDTFYGFTSYRQDVKGLPSYNFRITKEMLGNMLIGKCDTIATSVLSFGTYDFGDISIGRQLEMCFAGCAEAYEAATCEALPSEWWIKTKNIFCNYWVMLKDDFLRFMEWAWHKTKMLLCAMQKSQPNSVLRASIARHRGSPVWAIGGIFERLINIWCWETGTDIFDLYTGKFL